MKMEIAIEKMLLQDLLEEVEISDKNIWVSDPVSIGATDLFLKIKTDGHKVAISVVQSNMKGLEIDVLSVTEEL